MWTPLADQGITKKLCLLQKLHTGSVNLKFEDFGARYARQSTRVGSLLKLDWHGTNETPLQKTTIIYSFRI